MKNTVSTEFSFAEVWFTDQASKAILGQLPERTLPRLTLPRGQIPD